MAPFHSLGLCHDATVRFIMECQKRSITIIHTLGKAALSIIFDCYRAAFSVSLGSTWMCQETFGPHDTLFSLINITFDYSIIFDCYIWIFRQLTLQPSHVNAPKWNPAAGSPQTLHVWFICRNMKWKEQSEQNVSWRWLREPLNLLSILFSFSPSLSLSPHCVHKWKQQTKAINS